MRLLVLIMLVTAIPVLGADEPWIQDPESPFYFAVDVGDIDLVLPWYREAFGVELIDDTTAEDGRWRIANLGNDDFAIELIFDRRSTWLEEGSRVHGLAKVGVAVQDVESVANRIEASGAERPRVLEFVGHGIRLIQLKDPEGNTIQLHSPLEAAMDEEQILLQMHRDVLRYHIENDLDAWLAEEADDYISANRGEISRPTLEERRARLKPYLDSTTFTSYRDLVEPEVKVSADGTLGWVICQVEMQGSQEGEEFGATWAWIELYEKHDGRWIRVGNVSNRKPTE